MDLTLHPVRFPDAFEKWYIDTLLGDGTVLLIYLGALTLYGVRFARATVELFPPEGPVVRGGAVVHHIAGGEDGLSFGPVTIMADRLRFETVGLSGELVYHSRYPPCVLREPFLAQGERSLHWSVEIPDADVTGTLIWSGGRRSVTGRGYRDRVWFDLPPWRIPIRELIWGRAVAEEHAAMWVRATIEQEVVAAAWLDGQVVMTESASGLPARVVIRPGRVFRDTDVTAMEGLRLDGLRGFARRLSGDLHETKWQAPCTIAGIDGVAVHEVVRWRC